MNFQATDVTGVRKMTVGYIINEQEEVWLPVQEVDSRDVTLQFEVPIPSPYEDVRVQVRGRAWDCEDHVDTSAYREWIIGDCDTAGPEIVDSLPTLRSIGLVPD